MVFLCGFLPVVLTVYALCPVRFRNFFLFIASLFFYAWGEPRYIVIMLFSTVFDYVNGIAMEYLDRREKPQYRKWVLMLSVVVNIGGLAAFGLLLASMVYFIMEAKHGSINGDRTQGGI